MMQPTGEGFQEIFKEELQKTLINGAIYDAIVQSQNWIDAAKAAFEHFTIANMQITAKTYIRLSRFNWLELSLYDMSVLIAIVPMFSAKETGNTLTEYVAVLENNEKITDLINEAIKPVRRIAEKRRQKEIEHEKAFIEQQKLLAK